jgi:integrase
LFPIPRKEFDMPRKQKQTRRPRGSGSIFYDARRQQWVGRVPVRSGADGKRTKYREVRGASRPEVAEKMKAVEPPDPDEQTVSQLAASWLATLDVAASTRAGYERQVNSRIVPDLGRYRVRALDAKAVRIALAKWQDAGTATANRTRRVGATMWNEQAEGVGANPFTAVKKLKYAAKEIDPFTPDELRRIVADYRALAAAPLLSFLAGTGCRVGEACALDIADYDATTGKVAITKTFCRKHGTRPPKSKHSRRTLAVPAALRPVLAHAIRGRARGPLFAARTGGRYDPSECSVVFYAMLKKLGLRRRNPHQLRHGCISAAIASGAKLANVARDAGDSVSTIVNVYVHPDEGAGICEALDRLFSGGSPARERP